MKSGGISSFHLLAIAAITSTIFSLLSGSFLAKAPEENSNTILFTIPVGENGLHYEGLDSPEGEIWGPAGFTVAPDGSFWILDTAVSHILHYSKTGILLSIINLESQVVGITDIVIMNYGIAVLDQAAFPPRILIIDQKGNIKAKYDLPDGYFLEDGLIGISIGDNGELLMVTLSMGI